jgi:hypothetical protein
MRRKKRNVWRGKEEEDEEEVEEERDTCVQMENII